MMDPRVLDAMMPYMTYQFGNPHSRTHKYGWESEDALEHAREQIAHLIKADSKEIIFTSGATECNNLAVKGCANFYKDKKNHIITTQIEHKCVLDSCRYLERHGFEITYLPIQKSGRIDLNQLESSIKPNTLLVSVMGVNNEIGIMQPLKEIGKVCHNHGVFFHSDCAQMLGKEKIDVNDLGVDLMSMSGHKIYGPKGIGALYVRRRPRVRLEPIINGGGQERGLRSGTMPTHLAVGFGKACEIAEQSMEYDHAKIKRLSDKLINTLQSNV